MAQWIAYILEVGHSGSGVTGGGRLQRSLASIEPLVGSLQRMIIQYLILLVTTATLNFLCLGCLKPCIPDSRGILGCITTGERVFLRNSAK